MPKTYHSPLDEDGSPVCFNFSFFLTFPTLFFGNFFAVCGKPCEWSFFWFETVTSLAPLASLTAYQTQGCLTSTGKTCSFFTHKKRHFHNITSSHYEKPAGLMGLKFPRANGAMASGAGVVGWLLSPSSHWRVRLSRGSINLGSLNWAAEHEATSSEQIATKSCKF